VSHVVHEFGRVEAAAGWVREHISAPPGIAVVLGSGLGDFAQHVQGPVSLPYGSIPGWPVSTVVGHEGRLVVGTVSNRQVAVLSGRAHFYEGHPMATVVFATRVMGRLGVKTLILTNAAGGINT
jgi:purine-nucleoside phosphorylase